MFVIEIENWESFQAALNMIFGQEDSPDQLAEQETVRRYRVIHDQTGAIGMELITESE